MASFALLPSELLLHIFDLSTADEEPGERQSLRFSFGRVARAFYLATADATDLYLQGAGQGRALILKLEREREWAVQEKERKGRNGRTTRSTLRTTRITIIRRLNLRVIDTDGAHVFADLLRATPDLIALNLNVYLITIGLVVPVSLARLEVALGQLVGLKELKLKAIWYSSAALLSVLHSLKALEVLDLSIEHFHYSEGWEILLSLPALPALPNLRKLGIRLDSDPGCVSNALLAALLQRSTGTFQVLDLQSTKLKLFSSHMVEPLIPLLDKLVHLTWEPDAQVLDAETEDSVLALLSAMKGLESLSHKMWTVFVNDSAFAISKPLLDTLATLPSLETVELVDDGRLDPDEVGVYIKAARSLKTLSVIFETMEESYEGSHLIRILTPLTELQVLDLDFEICLTPSDTPPSMANLPHLHTLRTSVFGNPDVFVDALVLHALGSGLETLDLKWSGFDTISPEENVTAMIPHLANLAYLTWASDQVRLDRITQVAVRAVIAAMTGLQSISIVMWTLVDYRGDEDDSDHLHVDPRFFDTLKTLPALHTVELFVREAELEDEDLVISFIESAEALRSLHIHLETLSGWTRGQRDRVEAAAVAAGVVFVYPYSGVV
ncbi:hypothetical protein RQP46_011155 [Phenoliferia psychrophenolica]